MRFRARFLPRYLAEAPLALALERATECEILSGVPFRRPVLDIGCGDGLFAAVLFSEPIDVGIDIDLQELAEAGRRGAYRELIHCSAESVPKPTESFNTVIANSTLEHILPIERILAEAHRLLTPGGRLYLTVPSKDFERYTVLNSLLTALRFDGLASSYRRLYNSFWKHYHCYSLEGWVEMGRAQGFQVVEAYTYATPQMCRLNDFLVPFALPSFLVKKLFRRWVLSPRLRRFLWQRMATRLDPFVKRSRRCERGGLVFLDLQKPGPIEESD